MAGSNSITCSLDGPMIAYKYFIIISLFILTPFIAEASDGGSTVSIRTESWEGYTEEGDGYLFKLIDRVYSSIGYETEFKFLPFFRCVQSVADSKADIIAGVEKGDVFIGEKILVNKYPVYYDEISVAYREGEVDEWQGESFFKGKKGVHMRGYNYQANFSVPVDIIEVSSIKQQWQMLMSRRVDYIIDNRVQLEKYQRNNVDKVKGIVISVAKVEAGYLGFSNTARGRMLMAAFDEQYAKLKKSNAFQDIADRWLGKGSGAHIQ